MLYEQVDPLKHTEFVQTENYRIFGPAEPVSLVLVPAFEDSLDFTAHDSYHRTERLLYAVSNGIASQSRFRLTLTWSLEYLPTT